MGSHDTQDHGPQPYRRRGSAKRLPLLVALGLALSAAGCEWKKTVIHREFKDLEGVVIEGTDYTARVGLFPSRETVSLVPLIQQTGSPYVLGVRIRGLPRVGVSLRIDIVDTATGARVQVDTWESVMTFRDGSTVFSNDRMRLQLPYGDKAVSGTIRVQRETSREYSFSGTMSFLESRERVRIFSAPQHLGI